MAMENGGGKNSCGFLCWSVWNKDLKDHIDITPDREATEMLLPLCPPVSITEGLQKRSPTSPPEMWIALIKPHWNCQKDILVKV